VLIQKTNVYAVKVQYCNLINVHSFTAFLRKEVY